MAFEVCFLSETGHQAIFWDRIVADVSANILLPNFGPAGTRVLWFQPFENANSIEKLKKKFEKFLELKQNEIISFGLLR